LHFPPPPPPYIYTLSLHDALPILRYWLTRPVVSPLLEHSALHPTTAVLVPALHLSAPMPNCVAAWAHKSLSLQNPDTLSCISSRSEEHTSELQSRENLVCRLLLEK